MNRSLKALAAVAILPALASIALATNAPAQRTPVANPAIDMPGFLATAIEAARHRETRRLSETEFIAMSREPGTIVLDARSSDKFRDLHVEGAVNLSFPDITIDSLERLIPAKSARILIYCNNNFQGDGRAFPSKLPAASLNLSTYVALYTYGYRNIYELAPLLDVATTRLPLVSARQAIHTSGSADIPPPLPLPNTRR